MASGDPGDKLEARRALMLPAISRRDLSLLPATMVHQDRDIPNDIPRTTSSPIKTNDK